MGGSKDNRPTWLAGAAVAFVVIGIIFSDNRVISYSLLGIGVLLALIGVLGRARGG